MLKLSLVFIFMSFLADAYAADRSKRGSGAKAAEAEVKRREKEEAALDFVQKTTGSVLNTPDMSSNFSDQLLGDSLDKLKDVQETMRIMDQAIDPYNIERASELQIYDQFKPFESPDFFILNEQLMKNNPFYSSKLKVNEPQPERKDCNRSIVEKENQNKYSKCNELKDAVTGFSKESIELFNVLSEIHADNFYTSDVLSIDRGVDYCKNCYDNLLGDELKRQNPNVDDDEIKNTIDKIKFRVAENSPVHKPYDFLSEKNFHFGKQFLSAYFDNHHDLIREQLIRKIRSENKGISSEEINEKFKAEAEKLQCNNLTKIEEIQEKRIAFYRTQSKEDNEELKRSLGYDYNDLAQSCEKRSKIFNGEFKRLIRSTEDNIIDESVRLKQMQEALWATDDNNFKLLQEKSIQVSDENFILKAFQEKKESLMKLCNNEKISEIELYRIIFDDDSSSDFDLNLEVLDLLRTEANLFPILASAKMSCEFVNNYENLSSRDLMEYTLGGSGLDGKDKVQSMLGMLEKASERYCGNGTFEALGEISCFPPQSNDLSIDDLKNELANIAQKNDSKSRVSKIVISQMICNAEIETAKGLRGSSKSGIATGEVATVMEDKPKDTAERISNYSGVDADNFSELNEQKTERRKRVKDALAQAASELASSGGVGTAPQMATQGSESSSVINADDEQEFSYTDALNKVANDFQASQNQNTGFKKQLDEVLDKNPETKNAVGELAEKLREQLPPGEDSNEVLQEVLTSGKELTADDLVCSKPKKEDCEKDNQNLLAEIERLKKQVAQNVEKDMDSKNDENEKLKAEIAALKEELEQFKKIPPANFSSKARRSPSSISSQNVDEAPSSGSSSSYDTGRILSTSGSSGTTQRQTGSPVDNNITQMIPQSVLNDPNQYIESDKPENFKLSSNGDGLYLSISRQGIDNYPVDIGKVVMGDNGSLEQIYLKNSNSPIDISKLSKESLAALETFISKKQQDIPAVEREVGRQIASVESQIVDNSTEIVRYQELLCSLNSSRPGCGN